MSDAYVTAEEFTAYWFWAFDKEARVELNPLLRSSAGRIRMSLKASGQNNCSIDPDAEDYLKELNMIAAAVMFNMPCVRLSPEQRRLYAEYLNEQLRLIRTGEIELCAGHTGSQYPAFGVAEYGLSTRIRAEIIKNRELRNL